MSSSGKDAHRPRDKAPAQPGDYGRQGSPIRPDKFDTVSGQKVTKTGIGATRTVDRKFDEIDRSRVSTPASIRSDFYTDRPRSEATGGPLPQDGPRGARSYDPTKGGDS
jgi:hypothetical protein